MANGLSSAVPLATSQVAGVVKAGTDMVVDAAGVLNPNVGVGAGQIPKRDAAGKLALGDMPTGSARSIQGYYAGDNTANRIIDVGVRPKKVTIQQAAFVGTYTMVIGCEQSTTGGDTWITFYGSTAYYNDSSSFQGFTATGFKLGSTAGDYVNKNGSNFVYIVEY